MKSFFVEVTYFEVFFGQVWENPGKFLRTPKNLPAPTSILVWQRTVYSAGFTYRLYRLKPRASRSEGASSKLRYGWGQLSVQDQFDKY